jgi:heparosan-N-sulfate-glucuronate 5-epimerase
MIWKGKKLLNNLQQIITGTGDFTDSQWDRDQRLYPVALESTLRHEGRYYSPMDDHGIPMSYWYSQPVYSPTRIADYALAHYNSWITNGSEASWRNFSRMVEWFARSPDGLWPFRFDTPYCKGPWLSAMAQGQAISVLIRAYNHTSLSSFLRLAQLATDPLHKYQDSGGVRSKLNGGDFLEEYPHAKRIHTLNGFLYALIGLIDLKLHDDKLVASIGLDQLVDTLCDNIGLYDSGYWSKYDLSSTHGLCNISSVHYHALHITQLRYIGTMLNVPMLLSTAQRWKHYQRSVGGRSRVLASKSLLRLLDRTH